MIKATYHPEAGREVEFEVAEKNADGTVNLSHNGKVAVSKCPITDAPKVGVCVLVEEAQPKSELAELTVKELKAHADELGLNVDGLKKPEIINAIELATEEEEEITEEEITE